MADSKNSLESQLGTKVDELLGESTARLSRAQKAKLKAEADAALAKTTTSVTSPSIKPATTLSAEQIAAAKQTDESARQAELP